MKWFLLVTLLGSVLTLSVLVFKNSKYRISLKKIAIHWVLAAVVLFLLNVSELTSAYAVPITPLSLSTIAVLGVPGLALIQSIYILI